MNILFLDQFSDPGGAQLCLMDLMEGVRARGWDARVMVSGHGELVKWLQKRDILVESLPLSPLSNGSKNIRDSLRFSRDLFLMKAAIRSSVKLHKIDLVYVNGPRPLPAAIGLNCPVLFHAHSYVNGFGARALTDWAVRRTEATVVAASQFIANQYKPAVCDQIRVVYNGAADYARGPRAFDSHEIRVGILGRIAPEKGHLDFVRAARLIGWTSATFAVYGDSLFSNPEYRRRIYAEAAGTPIEFHGWRNDVCEILHEIDLLAVPSFSYEASTRVIMEAFSAGVPVVAYSSGGIPEVIENGRTGILTECSTPESLAKTIRQLQNNRPKMRELSLAARAEWEQRFTQAGFQAAICAAISTACRPDHN